MILRLLLIYILSIYSILIIHEFLHLIVAKFFKYNTNIKKFAIFPFKVEYVNNNKPLENLLIAIISPLFLFLVGVIIPLNYYTVILKLTCVINFFNLLPITADGEVILLSIFQILERKKNKD